MGTLSELLEGMGWGVGFPCRSGVPNENQKHKQIASRIFLFGDRSRRLRCVYCVSCRGRFCTILNATLLSAPVTSRLAWSTAPHPGHLTGSHPDIAVL